MRVIKLSPADEDMVDGAHVDRFFLQHLAERTPRGQFLLTNGRIAKDGIRPGELLVFSYKGEILYVARAESGRASTRGTDAIRYPFYFCVDVESIRAACGSLADLESSLREAQLLDGNLVKSQGWPTIDESGGRRAAIEQILDRLPCAGE